MARFKLQKGEELLYSEIHDWNTIIHRAKHGTVYVTNKRVVFCATATWKQIAIELYEERKSKNIRWEAEHNRIGFIDGRFALFAKAKYLTLDGKNTNVVVGMLNLIPDSANYDWMGLSLEELIDKLKKQDSDLEDLAKKEKIKETLEVKEITELPKKEKEEIEKIERDEIPNLAEELEKLAALKEKGLLTEEEFINAKAKLLN